MSEGQYGVEMGILLLSDAGLCLVKLKGYIFIGRFIPKQVSKQTPIKYTRKAVCVPVVNSTPSIYLICSVS